MEQRPELRAGVRALHALLSICVGLLVFSGCNCGRSRLARSGVCTLGDTQSCGPKAVGECHPGVQTCTDKNMWGPCQGAVYPAAEICDGKDNDCDGKVDDVADGGAALSQSCYPGPAGTEGVGPCHAGTQVCTDGAWGTCAGAVVPQPESCNGIDDDCDGLVDDQPDSGLPLAQSCYDGPDGTRGVGACRDGSQTCMGGAWTACAGSVTPSPETCNDVDDDCNGQVDDGVAPQSCYDGPAGTVGIGTCHAGFRTCSAGTFGACTGEVEPAAQDACDGLDETCDGTVNGGCPCTPGSSVPCYSGPAGTMGVGPCRGGAQLCSPDGGYGACTGDVVPAAETCNGVDDDCDGKVDNQPGSASALSQSCYDGPAGTANVGTCRAGTQSCTAGAWGTCQNEVTPAAEICDGRDNDCNGAVDNGDPGGGASCTLPGLKGPCAQGVLACADGGIVCAQTTFPTTETCNGVDDDCDGTVDNVAGSTNPLTQGCYTGPSGTQNVGLCKGGTQTCTSGAWGSCAGQVLPAAEVCNGKDDNCNGQTDEGIDAGAATCSTGLYPPCDVGHWACGADGGSVCVQNFTGDAGDADLDGYSKCTDCNDQNAAVHPGAAEVCDGVDNNCNGQVDEGFDSDRDCYTTCGTAYASHARQSDGGCDESRMQDGGLTDPSQVDCDDADPNVHPGIPCDCGAYNPSTNSCGTTPDGKDNNCNSKVDETCACDPVDHDGDGYSQCTGDCNDSNPAVHPGATELCNGIDDDCNPLTTDNCDVGQPCGFDGGADTCKSRYICATDVSTGVASCGDLCNFSQAGAGVGDGCLAGSVCGANLIASDNDHVCVPASSVGSGAAGSSCTSNAQCRSASCNTTLGKCVDLCGNDAYCGSLASCVIEDFPASPGLSYTEVYGGYCWPSSSPLGTATQGQSCGTRPTSPHCKSGSLACYQATGDTGTTCHQICCKQSDCPSGDFCGQGPAKNVGNFNIGGTTYPGDTGVPACVPKLAGQGTRLAGQACTNSAQCASDLCDASGVCLDFCCNDASCPTGLTCEFVTAVKANGHAQQMRLCVAPPTQALYTITP